MMYFKLDELLPHRLPMILLSDVVEYNLESRKIISKVVLSSKSMFFDKRINGVPAHIGLEYLAQTVGCLIGIENKKASEFELILGTKKFEIFIRKFEKDVTYKICAHEQFSIGKMSLFFGEIVNDENFVCAKGDIKIYYDNEEK